MTQKEYTVLATVAKATETKRKAELKKYLENYIDAGTVTVGEYSIDVEYQGHIISVYSWTDIAEIKTGCTGVPQTKKEAGEMWENSTLAVKYARQALMAYKYIIGGENV